MTLTLGQSHTNLISSFARYRLHLPTPSAIYSLCTRKTHLLLRYV